MVSLGPSDVHTQEPSGCCQGYDFLELPTNGGKRVSDLFQVRRGRTNIVVSEATCRRGEEGKESIKVERKSARLE